MPSHCEENKNLAKKINDSCVDVSQNFECVEHAGIWNHKD